MLIAIVTGNVGKDAEIRTTPSGDAVCSFDVCSNKGDVATWVRCSVWGKRGEKLAEFIKKGTRVTAVGELTLKLVDEKLRIDLRVDQLDFNSPKPKGEQP